jgi:flavodoxin
MSFESMSARLAKLREVRAKLCSKEHNWEEAFKAKDWITVQLKELLKIANDDQQTREDIVNRIEDVLCVLEPDDKENDDE